MGKITLSHIKLRKLRELLYARFGKWYSFSNRTSNIRYGRNLIDFVFRPKYTSLTEFCVNQLNNSVEAPIGRIIDAAYVKFILSSYSIKDKGADFKFNTIRNLFKWGFRSDDYMANHFADQLSLDVIKILRKELDDLDLVNIVIPMKTKIITVVRDFETGLYDYVRREFALLRAGPYRIRDPLRVVA